MPDQPGDWKDPEFRQGEAAVRGLKRGYFGGGNVEGGYNPLSDPELMRKRDYLYGLEQAGNEYGDRMRGLAGQQRPAVGYDTRGIQESAGRVAESYGRQREALALMKAQAAGQGPSSAAVQNQMQLDAQMRGQAGLGGGGLRGALMSGGMQNVANVGAQARAQEIGQAQAGFGASAQAMRGQSLEDRQQMLANAMRARDVNLSSQEQDLARRLKYEQLALQGYGSSQAMQNDLENAYAGILSDQMQRQMAEEAALTGMMSNTFAGMVKYGGAGGGGSGSSGLSRSYRYAPGTEDLLPSERGW